MSLKEWKNNEINTKLMKKWGLLKENKDAPWKDDPYEDDRDRAGMGLGKKDLEEGEMDLKTGGDLEEVSPPKISVREARELTRRIIKRLQEENNS